MHLEYTSMGQRIIALSDWGLNYQVPWYTLRWFCTISSDHTFLDPLVLDPPPALASVCGTRVAPLVVGYQTIPESGPVERAESRGRCRARRHVLAMLELRATIAHVLDRVTARRHSHRVHPQVLVRGFPRLTALHRGIRYKKVSLMCSVIHVNTNPDIRTHVN